VKLIVVALVAACGGSPPPPAPPSNQSVAVVRTDSIEAQIPGDADLVFYDEDPITSITPWLGEGSCRANVEKRIRGGFTASRPGQKAVTYSIGDTDRSALVQCVLEISQRVGPGWTATEVDAATTKISLGDEATWLTWHPTYFVVGDEPLAAASAPTFAQIETYQTMRRSRFAVWTSLPVIRNLLGIEARHVTVLLSGWDMPREWWRSATGTITIDLASPADAEAAAAKLRAGTLTGFTDPGLLAVLRTVPVTVTNAQVRLTLNKVEFDLQALQSALRPLLQP